MLLCSVALSIQGACHVMCGYMHGKLKRIIYLGRTHEQV